MRTIKWFFFLLFLVFFDQASKMWVLKAVGAQEELYVTPFLDILLVWNKGISYGWLSSWQVSYAQEILIALNACIVAILSFLLVRTSSVYQAIALCLIIGGALGNTCDRLFQKAVIDFLSFHVYHLRWYIFNLADVWITLGAFLLILQPLFIARCPRESSPAR